MTAYFFLDEAGVKARGQDRNGVFFVLAGSMARKRPTPSWNERHRRKRAELIESGVLVDSENPLQYQFTEDASFSSVSAAASIVLARETNGRTAWKSEESGETYAQWAEFITRTGDRD